MKKTLNLVSSLFLLFFGQAMASEIVCIDEKTDIIEKIKCLKSVSITSITEYSPTIKQIDMRFEQPMDHMDPTSTKFGQRIVLLHRAQSEPMILQTSGYSIFGVRESHLTRVFQTNQLQIEHRYFEESIPKNPNWSFLNIRQSAEDFHAITEKFQLIYKKPWVNTGASKGGMTSTYHRYFFPNDLAGTVADVAPLSFSTEDQRYNTFLEKVGGDKYKKCRNDFKNIQIELLKNKKQFTPLVFGDYEQLGSAEVALEHSITELSFAFWQYGSPSMCSDIAELKTVEEMFNLLSTINSPTDYSDTRVKRFMAYYYQAATQLGGPAALISHISHLLDHKLDLSMYTPTGVAIPYSNTTMLDVKEWALNDADNIMYVYGTLDPWTAAEYPLSIAGKKTEKYYVKAGNHSANFTELNTQDKAKAIKTLTLWLKKSPVLSATKENRTRGQNLSLEDIEFRARKFLNL